MAVVYAKFSALVSYQNKLENTLPELKIHSVCMDELIEDTLKKLAIGIENARKAEYIAQQGVIQAQESVRQAQEALARAEANVAQHNRNLPPDSEPQVVPEFYYSMVRNATDVLNDAENTHRQAQRRLDDNLNTNASFEQYVQQHHKRQEDIVLEYQKLLKKSDTFVDNYTTLLQKAKDVIIGESKTVDSQKYTPQKQSFLEPLENSATPFEYTDILSSRYENADPKVKKVYDQFKDTLVVQDSNFPITEIPHYARNMLDSHPRGIYYSAVADTSNPRGAGTTYYHELAHMIDHAAMGFQRNLSNTLEFANALNEDGLRILHLYNNLTPDRQQRFLARLRQDSSHSLSDLIDATTSGRLYGSYGHTRDYWSCPGNLQAEAFAHFFEAAMGSRDKRKLLESFFPTAFTIFMSMIETISNK